MAEENIPGFSIKITQNVLNKLDEVDKRINLIASNSENMASHYTSAMTRMGNGTDGLIDKLKEVQGIIDSVSKIDLTNLSSLSNSMTSVSTQAEAAAKSITNAATALNSMSSKNVNTSENINQQGQLYNKISELIDKLNKKENERVDAKGKTTKKVISMEEQISSSMAKEEARREKIRQREIREEERLRKAQERRGNNKALDAYNRAMAASEATVGQRINKIAKLRQANEMLSKSTKDYTNEIKNTQKETSRLRELNKGLVDEHGNIIKKHHKLMDTSGQLMRKLALVFSVSQITGYVKKVAMVTGEFEKQNVALAAILRNKEQANVLFGQITSLAVKSPFQLKELITYTKSLSAYQIEYEKLYDTTKMLADVSAGLGVDMQRLILAFGQVKAANFLRGTEVRQFTEAGFNILGELAEYYSELEGRMVSVGQVQDRVTKRMVAFGDVEEIFKRVTSAGGIFYNMQEKQANTIAGAWSNLRDSIDITLNKIGKENYDTIRGSIEAVKELVFNYGAVLNAIKAIAGLLVVYKLNLVLSNKALVSFAINNKIVANEEAKHLTIMQLLRVGLKKLSISFKAAAAAAKSFVASNIGVIAFFSVIYGIKELVEWNDRYNEAMKEVNNEHDATIASLNNLKDAYDKVAKSAKEASDAQEKSTSADKVYKDKFAQLQKLNKILTDKGYTLPVHIELVTPDNIDDVFKEGTELIKKGSEFSKEFAASINRGFTEAEGPLHILGDNLKTDLEDLSRAYENIGGAFNANLEILENQVGAVSDKFVGAAKEYYEQLKKGRLETESDTEWSLRKLELINKINSEYIVSSSYTKSAIKDQYLLSKLLGQRTDILKQEEEAQKEIVEKVQNLISDYGSLNKLMESANNNPVLIRTEIDRFFEKQELGEQAKRFARFWSGQTLKIPFTFEKPKDMPTFFNDFRDTVKVLDTAGIFKDQLQNIASIVQLEDVLQKRYKEEIENQDTLNRANTERLNLTKQIAAQEAIVADKSSKKDDIDAAKITLKNLREQKEVIDKTISDGRKQSKEAVDIIKAISNAFGLSYKDVKKSAKSSLDILKQQVDLIKKAADEYQRLTKYRSSAYAQQEVQEDFEDAFKSLGLSIDMDFSTSGVIDALENLAKTAGVEGQKYVQKVLGEKRVKLDIEASKENLERLRGDIEDAISSYDLFKDLDKVGVDKNIISQLFGIDITSVDDMKRKLMSVKDSFVKQGTEYEKVWKDAMQKVTDIEAKELNERMKKYAQYLKKTISERAAIELRTQEEIEKVKSNKKLDSTQKQAIIDRMRKEAKIAQDKSYWKDFQGSDLYIKMFEDLDSVSSRTLDMMQEKLMSLRESLKSLDPQDLKEINDRIDEIAKVKISQNPFDGLISNIKKLIEYRRTNKDLDNEYLNVSNEVDDTQKFIEKQEVKVELKRKEYAESLKVNGTGAEQTKQLKQNLDTEVDILNRKREKLKVGEKELNQLSKEKAEREQILRQTTQQINNIGSKGTQVLDSINITKDTLEEMGVSFGKTTNNILDGYGTVFKGLEEVDLTKPMTLVKANAMVLNGYVKIYKNMFHIRTRDERREREIQRELQLVEELQKAYQKLKEAIENAYDIDVLEKSTYAMNESLEKQNEALEKAINAEERKKKTDHGRIDEWKKQIEENEKMIKQNTESMINALGGLGSSDAVKSAAQEFTDAWLNAFIETGNGLKGLEDNMKNMLKNIVSKQLSANITKKYFDPIVEELNKAFEKDSQSGAAAMPEELAEFAKKYKESMIAADKSFSAVMEALKKEGIDLGEIGKKSELSGLQRGIQGVSEQTADVLASITESIRYFSADSNMQLKSIYNLLINPSTENPFLSELRLQTRQMQMIYAVLGSVSTNLTGKGKVLKVQLM